MPPRDSMPPVLVRLVEGVQGSVTMDCLLRMRLGYGQIIPWVRRVEGRIVAVAGPDSLWLDTPVTLTGRNLAHHATFTVSAGERIPFTLTWMPSHEDAPGACDALDALALSERFWQDWSSRCTYQGTHRDAVVRSLITLKALTYQPTGGIVAAATTSLPEDIGGVRNWDYRYCWLRDATITLEALLRTGYTEEAFAWRTWLERAIAGEPARRPDHVRCGGRAQTARMGGRLAARVRGLGAGQDRQRGGGPAPAGRLRRGDRRADARAAGRDRR